MRRHCPQYRRTHPASLVETVDNDQADPWQSIRRRLIDEIHKTYGRATYLDSAADNIYGVVFCDSDSS